MKKYLRSLLLLGCTPLAIFAQKEAKMATPLTPPSTWQTDTLFRSRLALDDCWWHSLDDALLDSLITASLQENQNLLATTQRIAQAKAQWQEEQGAYAPSFTLQGGWLRGESSGRTVIGGTPRIGSRYGSLQLATSWEIDLFGSIRRRVAAQRSNYRASLEERAGVELSLAAAIATHYAQLRTVQGECTVAQRNIESLYEILQITEARYHAGLVSQLDVAQAETYYYGAKASLPSLKSTIRSEIGTLALLVGCFPSQLATVLEGHAPLPNFFELVGVGVPADLVRRRPDIRQAEEEVAASAALLGASKADLLPQLTLTGYIGYEAGRLNHLFEKESLAYEIAPTLSWKLFQGGELRAAKREAEAIWQEALFQYNQTVLNAVQEVESAMSQYLEALHAVEAWRLACRESEESLQLSLSLYREGLSSFQQVLNAQSSALSYQNSLVESQGAALIALIALHQGLGGTIYN